MGPPAWGVSKAFPPHVTPRYVPVRPCWGREGCMAYREVTMLEVKEGRASSASVPPTVSQAASPKATRSWSICSSILRRGWSLSRQTSPRPLATTPRPERPSTACPLASSARGRRGRSKYRRRPDSAGSPSWSRACGLTEARDGRHRRTRGTAGPLTVSRTPPPRPAGLPDPNGAGSPGERRRTA
jgi:hypothetical protein